MREMRELSPRLPRSSNRFLKARQSQSAPHSSESTVSSRSRPCVIRSSWPGRRLKLLLLDVGAQAPDSEKKRWHRKHRPGHQGCKHRWPGRDLRLGRKRIAAIEILKHPEWHRCQCQIADGNSGIRESPAGVQEGYIWDQRGVLEQRTKRMAYAASVLLGGRASYVCRTAEARG